MKTIEDTRIRIIISTEAILVQPSRCQSLYKDIALGAGGSEFVSQAGQVEHSVANGSPLLSRFFGAVLPRR